MASANDAGSTGVRLDSLSLPQIHKIYSQVENLYVDGTLVEADKVLVDIGTGYYIKLCISDAKDFFNRRIEYIEKQKHSIDSVLLEKSNILSGK
ncbi:hypothetical protein MXB_1056 [Myxobolus squamalis]|nr:hypothetical protein MXB_1056 [Myxobolus squamalis]